MPTDVISKVGATNSPTTMDYSTLQAWEDACPSNLTTVDQRWIGECYDQGEFTGTGQMCVVAGMTVDATRYVILRCATGASFSTKAAVRTTALFYDSTKGVAIRSSIGFSYVIQATAEYTRLYGLQIKATGSNARPVRFDGAGNQLMDSCICYNPNAGALNTAITAGTLTLVNSLFITDTNGYGYDQTIRFGNNNKNMYGCTVIGPATSEALIHNQYGTLTTKNCAFFRSSGSLAVFNTGAGSTVNRTYCATDAANLDGPTGTNTNNTGSLTLANQFENSASDLRAKSSGNLNVGTPDLTNTPIDISVFTRNASVPWVGCWEAVIANTSGLANKVVNIIAIARAVASGWV